MKIEEAFDGLIGHFNSVRDQSKKQEGLLVCSPSSSSFCEVLDNISLIDLGFLGLPFTWNSKRSGVANIQERLDRGVANASWRLLLPHAEVSHLTTLSLQKRAYYRRAKPSVLCW